jgi:hypothetical protein
MRNLGNWLSHLSGNRSKTVFECIAVAEWMSLIFRKLEKGDYSKGFL